jgi:hypothetical protein
MRAKDGENIVARVSFETGGFPPRIRDARVRSP